MYRLDDCGSSKETGVAALRLKRRIRRRDTSSPGATVIHGSSKRQILLQAAGLPESTPRSLVTSALDCGLWATG